MKKLERSGVGLLEEDRERLAAVFGKVRQVAPRDDIVCEGDNQNTVHLIKEGVACRYKLMAGGKRAILAYLIAGDFCDLQHMILGKMDHAVCALTLCVVAEAPRADLEELCETSAPVRRALWRITLGDEAISRAWMARLSQVPADKLLACLLCEMRHRLEVVGLVENGTTFKLGLTQEEIGDMLGVTAVHVNRVMQQLRESGLIQVSGKSIIIPEPYRLELFADFDPGYLHFTKMPVMKS